MASSVVEKPLLFCDTETFCETPITNGTWRYAEDVEVTLFTYAYGMGKVKCWDVASGAPMPEDLAAGLNDPEQMTVWHNSGFDIPVIHFALGIDLPPSRVIDTMVIALSHGLPGSLDKLCDILGVSSDAAKHKTGKALVLFFCKLQPFKHNITKDFGTPAERKAAIAELQKNWTGRATQTTHPQKWQEFIEYALADITSMRELYFKKLAKWNYPNNTAGERDLWILDAKINARGVCVDVAFAKAAIRAAERAKVRLAADTLSLTNGEVEKATKRDQMIDHIFAQYGVSLADMKKSTLNALLDNPDIPEELCELLRVRLQATSTSVSKYSALVKGVSSDGRLRGTLQFSGAPRTKRFSGKTYQPQNLPRLNELHVAEWLGIPVINGRPARDITDNELDSYFTAGIQAVLADGEEFFFDETMLLLSNCIRGSITVPEGKKMVVADLAGIEGRVIAWICGEGWKLQAYRDFDTYLTEDDGFTRIPNGKGGWLRKGNDLYNVAYGKSFGLDPAKVDKFQRQIGKVQELACLGKSTLVLTKDKGYIAISDVTTESMVWDGINWVQHKGLVHRGVKPTIKLAGLNLTAEHLILTQQTWRQAKQLASNESTLCLALATGSENLPYLSLRERIQETFHILSLCSVPAGLRHIGLLMVTCAKALVQDVRRVLLSKMATIVRISGGTPILWHQTTTGADYSTVYPPVSTDATTQKTLTMRTMAAEASTSMSLGAKTDAATCPTSLPLMGGIKQRWNLTVSTLIKVISPTTYASSAIELIRATAAKLGLCKKQSSDYKKRMPVYDLLSCGPNNRFTILSDRGPLIVHNCGFQGGVGAFVAFATAFGIDVDDMADKAISNISVDTLRESENFMLWAKEKGLPDFGLSDKAYIVCNAFKMLWRQAHPQISSYWKELENDVRSAIASPNEIITSRKVKIQLLKGWLRIRLPSGGYLCYPQAQVDEDGSLSFNGVNQFTRKWGRIQTSGGKLLENIVQATARDIFCSSMQPAEDAGFQIVLHIHDEILAEVPDTPEYSVEKLSAIMSTQPSWAKDIPLAAAGFETIRYRKG